MEAKAVAKYIRIAPRKLRIVINLIRGKSVGEAFAILKFTPKVGSEVIVNTKVLSFFIVLKKPRLGNSLLP